MLQVEEIFGGVEIDILHGTRRLHVRSREILEVAGSNDHENAGYRRSLRAVRRYGITKTNVRKITHLDDNGLAAIESDRDLARHELNGGIARPGRSLPCDRRRCRRNGRGRSPLSSGRGRRIH